MGEREIETYGRRVKRLIVSIQSARAGTRFTAVIVAPEWRGPDLLCIV